MQWAAKRRREERRTWSRLTITLSSKALEILDYVRNAQDSSASEAIDYLILKTEPRKPHLKWVDGFPVLDVEDDGPSISNQDVLRMQEDEDFYDRKRHKPTPRRVSIAISPEASNIVAHFRQIHGNSRSTSISRLIEMSE